MKSRSERPHPGHAGLAALRGMFDQMDIAVAVYRATDDGADFTFVHFNPAAERIEGMRMDELLGRTLCDVFPGATDLGLLDALRRVWRTGVPESMPPGTYKDPKIEVGRHNHICKLPSGEIVAFYRDTTEDMQRATALLATRSKLKATVRRFSDIADHLGGVFWECSPDWQKLYYVSPAYAAVWGRSVRDLLDRPLSWMESIHPEDRAAMEAAVQKRVAGDLDDPLLPDYRILRPDGGVRWIAARAFPVRGDDGEVLRIVGIAEDITVRRLAQHALEEVHSNLKDLVAERTAELREANVLMKREVVAKAEIHRQLQQAQKMEAVGQLTSGIAHDFNNLLAIIKGNAALLSKKRGDPAVRLAAIQQTVDQGSLLIRRLSALSQKRQLALEPIRADLLVRGLLDMLRRTLGIAIDVRVVADPDLWSAVADHGELEIALLNLTINAQDAMPEGGTLEIRCKNEHITGEQIAGAPASLTGDFVTLTITDNGSGIREEDLERVFDPFFTTKGIGQGSGLGLSMVYGYAQQSNGFVTISSELGCGTSVRLGLPRHIAVEPTDESDEARQAANSAC